MPSRLEPLLKLHATEPDDPFLTYSIGLEHTNHGSPADAIAWFDKTLALDPHYHYAYFQKAKALDALDRTEEAAAVLNEGIRQACEGGDAKAEGELAGLLDMIGGD